MLADHHVLCDLLREMGSAAWRVMDGDEASAGVLRQRLHALGEPLGKHLEVEEERLRPILEPIADWGPQELIYRHVFHVHLREAYDVLVEQADDGTEPPLLAAAALRLLRELRQDLEEEEHDLLHPDALRMERLASS